MSEASQKRLSYQTAIRRPVFHWTVHDHSLMRLRTFCWSDDGGVETGTSQIGMKEDADQGEG